MTDLIKSALTRAGRLAVALSVVGSLLAAPDFAAGQDPEPETVTPVSDISDAPDLRWPDPGSHGVKRGKAPAVAPAAGGPQPAGPAAPSPPSSESIGLAAALGNDPLAIYNYVRTGIAPEAIWGVLRDAHRTALEGAGTAADQAFLLVDLLRAAGASASYRTGTLRVPLDLAASWVRVDQGTATETCNRVFRALASGGVPVPSSQPCLSNLFEVQHVWVVAVIGGVTHELDPSIKRSRRIPQIGLPAAMAYDRPAFLAAAESGATIGADSVVNLNVGGTQAKLEGYAAGLVSHLESTTPHAHLDEVVGGWELSESPASSLPTTLSHTKLGTPVAFDDFGAPGAPELRHRVSVTVGPIVLQSTLHALSGRRLTYEYSGPLGQTGTMRLEGTTVGTTTSASPQNVRYCVDAPFAAFGGTYGDECTDRRVVPAAGNTYAFVTDVGRAPGNLLAERREVLARNLEAFPGGGEPVLGESLNVMALAWFNENGLAERLQEGVARVNGYRFHGMAVMSQETSNLTSFGIDVRLNFVHVYSPTANTADERVFFTASAAEGSGIEHAFIEQLQGKEGISTIRVLEIATAQGVPIFHGTSSNWGRVRPQLSYGASILAALDAVISSGGSLVVPRNNVSLNRWTGTGWIQFFPNSEAYIIAGGLAGGFGTEGGPLDPFGAEDPFGRTEDELNRDVDAADEGDPVDPTTGAFVLGETDLQVVGAQPLGLQAFGRSYNHRLAGLSGPMGRGWRHNYMRELRKHTSYERGLAGPEGVETARLVAQSFVQQDLLRATLPEHERRAVGALTTAWGMDRLQQNTYVLMGPTSATFVELPGGRFSRTGRAGYDLATEADGSLTVRSFAGHAQRFARVTAAGGAVSWRLASWTDGNGNLLTLDYDAPGAEGKVVSVGDAVGRALTLTYTSGRVTRVSDSTGRLHQYGYDATGNLTTHTDARGGVTTYRYDAGGRIVSITDPLGQTFVTNAFDATNRVVRQTDAKGNVSELAFGERVTRVRDPMGIVRTVAWTTDRKRMLVTDELGGVTTSHFDASGNLIRLEEPEASTWTFAYDARDNLTKSTDPLGAGTELAFGALDLPTLVRDQVGKETRLAYDAEGNLTSVTNALGQVTTFGYDVAGRPTEIVEPLTGARTRYTYDTFGYLASATNPAGETSTFSHDAVGRILAVTDPLGNRSSFAWEDGNLVGTTDPLGHSTVSEYNANNRRIRFTDALGRSTLSAYDVSNNLNQLTRPDGSTVRFEYDANGRAVVLVDPRGNRWGLERNQAGLVSAEADPLGARRTYSYDRLRRMTRRVDAEGHVTTFRWDAAGRLIEAAYDDGTSARYGYTADGLLSTSSLGGWNASYEYDALGRLIAETYPYVDRRVEYTWDQLGSQVSPGDRMRLVLKAAGLVKDTTTYEYDAAHRLVAANDGAGRTTNSYDRAGRLTRTTLPGGASIEQAYDAASRILRVVNRSALGAPFASFESAYNQADRVTRVTRGPPGLATDYTYDLLDRLVSERSPRGEVTYTYDAAGNRLRRTDAAGATDSTYDAANQLLRAGPTTYSYDRNGNLVRKATPAGTTTFAWDRENRLTAITPPAGPSVALGYDTADRRVSRREAAVATVHRTYDGLRPLAEGDVSLTAGSVWFGALRAVEHRRSLGGASLPVAFTVDRLGSVTALADGAGRPRDAYTYDAFGFEGLPAGVDANTFGFVGTAGVEREASVPGLMRMGLRYYDAEAGRFISRDPIGFLGGDTNLYAYAGSSPTNFADPSGLFLDVLIDIGFILYDIYQLATGSEKDFAANLTALGADVLGAVTPGLTGLGAATRAARGASRVRRAGGATDNIVSRAGRSGDGIMSPGPHAGESIPARGPQRDFTAAERAQVDRIGRDTGCHRCGTTDPGTKGGHFVPDHQPPNQVNPPGNPQQLYPHCIHCSRTQGGTLSQQGRR